MDSNEELYTKIRYIREESCVKMAKQILEEHSAKQQAQQQQQILSQTMNNQANLQNINNLQQSSSNQMDIMYSSNDYQNGSSNFIDCNNLGQNTCNSVTNTTQYPIQNFSEQVQGIEYNQMELLLLKQQEYYNSQGFK